MANRYLVITIVVSNVFFWVFFVFGLIFWLDNREAKASAQYHYQEMQAVSQQCAVANSTVDEVCHAMAQHRIALEKFIQKSGDYDSLTRLFIAFAVFIPLITWASYFLTRAIFR